MRRSIATPCPVATSQNRIADETYTEDTTANLEYTTAFHASFRNVRPKRGQLARRDTINFAIHEDADIPEIPYGRRLEEQAPRLLNPAKRVVTHKRIQDEIRREDNLAPIATSPIHVHHVKARRLPNIPKRVHAESPAIPRDPVVSEKTIVRQPDPAVERPARRKTLYIPSDDTTQPTMWMGIFSPVKNEVGQNSIELTGIAAQMAEKKRRRTSANQAKAKRLPLHQNTTAQAQAIETPNRPGAPTGKENLPPGHQRRLKQQSTTTAGEHEERKKVDRDSQRRDFIAQARIDKLSRSKNQSGPSSPDICTMYEIGQDDHKIGIEKQRKIAWNAGPRAATKEEKYLKPQRHTEDVSINAHKSQQPSQQIVPTRFVQPRMQNVLPCPPPAPVIEHIEYPEMYEEDWLGQQEIAMTQLLNSILSQAQGKEGRATSSDEIRSRLLSRYNQPDICLAYRRVQAAALYGSLSLPHEAIFQIQNLVNDVGRRKAFLGFWIDNYDNELLQIALEVVSGRQVDAFVSGRSMGTTSPVKIAKRRSLASFFDSFILRHEDSQFKAAGAGVVGDLGSKTILKSLMLLKALDLLKENQDQIADACLFRKSAAIKSSATAIRTLMQMLNPAVGDSIRALRQLGYSVSHQQEPMDELTCRIENMAVDLRDGVCLTRLVEVLLYRSRSSCEDHVLQTKNDTITIFDNQVVSFSRQEDHPLSRHLKLPCTSRAAKMWNVQIALGALRKVRNIERLMEDIGPEDIVDGYREKTIKVIWTIVGRWGLTELVDKNDLRREIVRLSCHEAAGDCLEEDNVTNPQMESERLVKQWVEAVASSKGIQVRNFTTSFSDGRIFKAILDEYEPYLVKTRETQVKSLQERLARLGCSQQFSDLFCSNDGQVHILGKDFVLAALAFLCSRVVGPSKVYRNVIRIQRCWRRYWSQVEEERRVMKRDLAEACASSVGLRSGHVPDHQILTAADLGSVGPGKAPKTEVEEDIWLSL